MPLSPVPSITGRQGHGLPDILKPEPLQMCRKHRSHKTLLQATVPLWGQPLPPASPGLGCQPGGLALPRGPAKQGRHLVRLWCWNKRSRSPWGLGEGLGGLGSFSAEGSKHKRPQGPQESASPCGTFV